MNEYKEWVKQFNESRPVSFYDGAIAAWQHQQAKVEEANAKAQMCRDEKNHAINRWTAVCKERDELQKRVDVLTQTMEELLDEMKYPTATFEEVIVCGAGLLEQALKGGEDASN